MTSTRHQSLLIRQLTLLPLLMLGAACCSRAQSADQWVTVSQGGDGERQILASSLQGAGSIVRYTAKHRSGQSEYRMHVQVDCARGERRDHIPPNAPESWFALSRLLPSMVEESLFACRWLRGDPVARDRIQVAHASPKDAVPPTSGAPSVGAVPTSPAVAPPERKLLSSGSGFLVSSRQVITNHHVVDGCNTVTVRQDDQTRTAAVASKHSATDLAILVLDNPLGRHLPVRSSAVLGEDVMVAGHPLSTLLSSDLTVTTGQVNSLSGLANDPTLFQLSASVHSGNSGGPVLDGTGAVVGVVVSKLNALKLARATGEFPQNINFAIKPEVLRLFLDTNRVRYEIASPSRKLDGPQLANRARQATVQVLCAS